MRDNNCRLEVILNEARFGPVLVAGKQCLSFIVSKLPGISRLALGSQRIKNKRQIIFHMNSILIVLDDCWAGKISW